MKARFAILLAALLCACPPAQGEKPAAVPPVSDRPVAKPVQKDITAQDYEAPPLPKARVTLTDAYGGPHVVEVEVAATSNSRTRGLMWRKQLAEGEGMIFIFAQSAVQGFWMRNTLIPLDMLFIEEGGVVAGIVSQAEPQTLTSRTVGKPTKYVLEVPGGWCQKIGVVAGSKVALAGLQAFAPEP